MRLLGLSLLLFLSPALAAEEPSWTLDESNAVLINISEADLNRIAREVFRAGGGPEFEGSKAQVSQSVTGLSYRAELSEPVLRLGADGWAWLSLDILRADLHVGRMERRFMRRMASCDDLGVRVERDRPVDVTLALRFMLDNGDLQIVPQGVTLDNTKGFRLIKPSECRNTILPKWLLWWVGKSRIRRQIERLDEVLLAGAWRSASDLNEETSEMAKHWRVSGSDEPRPAGDFRLYPQALDTSKGSLFVSLAGSSREESPTGQQPPGWIGPLARRSFLGLSEPFLNGVLRLAAGGLDSEPRRVGGGLAKLFRSESVLALIPGLSRVEPRDAIRLGLVLHRPPELELGRIGNGTAGSPASEFDEGNRAVIRIRLSGIEIALWDPVEHIGSVWIDSAVLSVVPFHSPLGGISFDVLENDWSISAEGIELDEPVLAATLQELFFGEIFETGYEPVARGALDIGGAAFNPRFFSLIGQHLVIGLTDF